MVSYIFFIRIYRLRFGRVSCYVITLVILLLGVRMVYYRNSFEADGDKSDAKRVAMWQRITEDESCHLSKENDALELLDKNATLPAKSIFFHETSCKGDLTSRQLCAVESAAKAHPHHQINVFFTSPVSKEKLENGYVSTLQYYENVKIARVLINDYAAGTPIASKVAHMTGDNLNKQMSKIMKFLSLYKYGGIYLSFDVIVARRLDLWNNWAVKDTPKTLSSDMFAFSNNNAGRSLIHEAMRYSTISATGANLKRIMDISPTMQEILYLLLPELEEHGRHDLWSYSRPSVITDLLQYWCATGDVKRMTPLKCRDLVVHGPELFYPISFHNRSQYFRTVDGNSWKHKLTHTYFIWHRFTKYNIITPGSIYGRIAHEFCPITYQRYSGMSGVWYSEYDDMHDSILD